MTTCIFPSLSGQTYTGSMRRLASMGTQLEAITSVTEVADGWYSFTTSQTGIVAVFLTGADAEETLWFNLDLGSIVVGVDDYYAAVNAVVYFSDVERSTDDTSPIRFLWSVNNDTITGNKTKVEGVGGATSSGTITATPISPTGQTRKGRFEYAIPWNAADRTVGEGTVIYTLSGTSGVTETLVLRIYSAVASSGEGNGAYGVTISVTASSVGVPNATVVIKQGATQITWANTNSSGQVVFRLDAGSYTATVQSMPGYQPHTPQSFSVSGDSSVSLTLFNQSITPPANPGLSAVRFLVLDSSGNPVENAKVTVALEEKNPSVDTALVSRTKYEGSTNSSGYVDLTMIQYASFTRGGIYNVLVADSAGRRLHERRVRVPSLASCYAEDLLDA